MANMGGYKKRICLLPVDQLAKLPTAIQDIDLQEFLKSTSNYFNKKRSYLTANGRMAIAGVLKTLELTSNDEVFITTTFEYPNISSCVTCTVFNFCKPSRILTENTKAIFIIHEFGVPHPKTFELIDLGKKRNIPVIEDCAHTINSYFEDGQKVGSVGDWTIVSFPKIFPVYHGGLLVGNNKVSGIPAIHSNEILNQTKIVNGLWQAISEITEKRAAFFNLFKRLLTGSKYEFIVFSSDKIMPWFFPLKSPEPAKLMKALRENNIECGLWHGTNIIVLPLHQYLTKDKIVRVCSVLTQHIIINQL